MGKRVREYPKPLLRLQEGICFMGDMAEMMLDGTLCVCCGVLLEESGGDGIPVRCPACGGEDNISSSKIERAVKKKAQHE